MMAPIQRGSRVNLQDFKARMMKILGPTKEEQYCLLLSRYLNLRLSKEDLDRMVPSTIGKENVILHNNLVRAIISNATCDEPPPPPAFLSDISKPLKGIRRKPTTPLAGTDDGPTSVSAGLQGPRSNGDGFTVSPRKGRSVIRDRKGAERPSPLGNHRVDASTGIDDDTPRAMENGHLAAPDLLRPLQLPQCSAEQPEDFYSSHPAKRPRYEDAHVQEAKPEGDGAIADTEHEEEDEDLGTNWLTSSDVNVPLGIPFCRPSAGGARMAPAVPMPPGPITLSMLGYAVDDEECSEDLLPGVETIRQRVQMGACLDNGLESCDADSAAIIKLALDMYLQRILKTVIELNQSNRSSRRGVLGKEDGAEKTASQESSIASREKRVNGWNQLADGEDEQPTISPRDFYVALDLDHSKLGVNWPILLEKILLRVFWDQ